MALYEHILMARQDVSAQQVEEMVTSYTAVLEELGGSVVAQEYWGLKSLTYRMRKNRKAHYSLLRLDAPPAAIAEMERQMRIDENVLRFMTIKVEEHEEGPSVMMQKRDRDDRRPGGSGRFGDRPPRGDRDDRPPRGDRDDRPPRREQSSES